MLPSRLIKNYLNYAYSVWNIYPYLAKFANFIHRDPHLKNVKFKFATLCVSKAMSPHLTCSGVREGLEKRVCLRQLRVHSTTQRKAALRKQKPLPPPRKKRKVDIKRELFCLASLCSLPSLRSITKRDRYARNRFLKLGMQSVKRRQSAAQAFPLTRRLNLMRNAKFNQAKFSFLRCGSRRANLEFARKICLKRRIFVAVIVADML